MNELIRRTRHAFEYFFSAGITCCLVVTASLLMFSPRALNALQWNATDSLAGSWRVITCHMTHWSLNHFVWDALALVVLGAVCERNNRATFVATLVCSAVLIPLATLFFCPDIESYRGLSGVDSGLFTLAACQFAYVGVLRRDWFLKAAGGAALGIFVLKIGFEVVTGGLVFVSDTSFVPLPISHVVGAAVGIAAFGYYLLSTKIQSTTPIQSTPVPV